MKKRTIIAIFITILITCLINPFWLTIKPKENNISISAKTPPKRILAKKKKYSIKFQFEIFVIIIILSFLLSYKFTDYLADFKTVKNQSRSEIIFLLIFFSFLFIPMSNINKNEISQKENRTLKKWEPFINNEQINFNFGRDFDEWFSDRFFLRYNFVEIEKFIKYHLAYNYYEAKNIFLNKKTHWMCKKPFDKKELCSKEDVDKIISNLEILKDFCKKNNLKFYIIIAPTKQDVYKNELYPFLKTFEIPEMNLKIIKQIEEKTSVKIIYPYKELKKLSDKEYAFFKTDHHWTDEGANIARLMVSEQIKKDFPNIYINQKEDFNYFYSNKIRVMPLEDFHNGATYKYLALHDKKILDSKYKYFEHKNSKNISFEGYCEVEKKYCPLKYKFNQNAPNLTLFGDSFILNLLSNIVYDYNKTNALYAWAENEDYSAFDIEKHKTDILKDKPRVLILCFASVKRLIYIFEGKN